MSPESSQLVLLARRHHHDGQLSEAEHYFREALTEEYSPCALHGLGLVSWQTGQFDDARRYLQQACADAPEVWAYAFSLGHFFAAIGLNQEAFAAFRRAKILMPQSAQSWLGYADALLHLGRVDESISAYRHSVRLEPGNASIINNLVVALNAAGKLDEALVAWRDGLTCDPAFMPLYNNMGNGFLNKGQIDDAIAAFRKGVKLEEQSADLWFNLGNAYSVREAGYDAQHAYRQALILEPAHHKALINSGNVMRWRGELDGAMKQYRRALLVMPEFYDARNNAGVVQHLMGELDDATLTLHRAVALAPQIAVAYVHLGNTCRDGGRIDDALLCYRRAMMLDPHSAEIHGNLLYALHFHPASGPHEILQEAIQFGLRHDQAPHAIHANRLIRAPRTCAEGKRLRIGYISPDFRNHCQSNFTIPLLSHHDRTRFEVFCYANLAKFDALSARVAAYADEWRPIFGETDARVAEMIAADDIDILVNLTMHMANGRPMLFAHRAAPVQVAWLAYPGTTGMPAIDYRITDPWLDPPEHGNGLYTEKSAWLPDTFWCYDPLTDALLPNELPALGNGHITFGCLNNFCKITDDTLSLWGKVLACIPSSRLILLAHPGSSRQRVYDKLAAFDITPERIGFVGYQPRLRYLQTYHHIDICLDTIPYNGHTTSLDAYWMGVPVITLVGKTVVGRAGWSQLNNLDMQEMAAFDEPSFVDIACALGQDLPRLARLRQTLRSRMHASPLMDAKRFALAMENLYGRLWEEHRR